MHIFRPANAATLAAGQSSSHLNPLRQLLPAISIPCHISNSSAAQAAACLYAQHRSRVAASKCGRRGLQGSAGANGPGHERGTSSCLGRPVGVVWTEYVEQWLLVQSGVVVQRARRTALPTAGSGGSDLTDTVGAPQAAAAFHSAQHLVLLCRLEGIRTRAFGALRGRWGHVRPRSCGGAAAAAGEHSCPQTGGHASATAQPHLRRVSVPAVLKSSLTNTAPGCTRGRQQGAASGERHLHLQGRSQVRRAAARWQR